MDHEPETQEATFVQSPDSSGSHCTLEGFVVELANMQAIRQLYEDSTCHSLLPTRSTLSLLNLESAECIAMGQCRAVIYFGAQHCLHAPYDLGREDVLRFNSILFHYIKCRLILNI